MTKKSYKGAITGAAFLMATSAIGPGFLTQTTVFTGQLFASFGFVILFSILLDIAAQLNIWRVVAVSNKRAQDLANDLFPGLGYVLAALIVIGGLAFNIGNVAGAGLGFKVLFGIDAKIGAIISAIVAVGIFLSKEAGETMDNFARILGFVMIILILYVVFVAKPPILDALHHTIIPQKFDAFATITLVGGTIGGYITFAGVHRLIDAGLGGQENLPQVNKSATTAILVTAIVRYLLFLASLGVVVTGFSLSKDNPAASVFQQAAGNIGYKIFGIVIWSAALTSVVGAAYTSVSFFRTFHPVFERLHKAIIIGFIIFSTIVFVAVGNPVSILVWVGTLNGFILPVGLAIVLLASRKAWLMGTYRHSVFLQVIGWIVVAAMLGMAIEAVTEAYINGIRIFSK